VAKRINWMGCSRDPGNGADAQVWYIGYCAKQELASRDNLGFVM
jgi:hypothetical protein